MAITINHLTKRYHGDVLALNDLDLTIEEGEFMVIVGPSGCGKTTLLRIMAGLETYDEGTVTCPSSNISMIFQNNLLYPHMSVYDNIHYGLGKEKNDHLLIELTQQLGIDHLLQRKPHQLSGGQRQRVALAKALIKNPNVLLMDEPLSQLDQTLRQQLSAFILKIQKERHITMIYVTHSLEEAYQLADRITVMNQGKIMQTSTPIRLYREPKDMFVASFTRQEPLCFIKQTNYYMAFHASDIHQGTHPYNPTLHAIVTSIKTMGDILDATLTINQQPLSVKLSSTNHLTIGQTISIWVPQECCLYFDLNTKRLLTNQQPT